MKKSIDFYNLPLDDEKTWDLIKSGRTKGVFQCDSKFVQMWINKIQPKNLEELAALISLVRPGGVEAKFEGKSIADHYAVRKRGEEEHKPLHPKLEGLFKETYSLLSYQEQQIELVKKLAGFDLETAELFRYAVGKKKAHILNELKPKFIEGCENNNISEKEAEEIYSLLEKSSRYIFNKCLNANTLVQTSDGKVKTLEEINISEYITAPEDMQKDKCVQVLDKYDNGLQEVYQITLESGKQIECTLEHQFLCEDWQKRPLYEILEKNIKLVCEND